MTEMPRRHPSAVSGCTTLRQRKLHLAICGLFCPPLLWAAPQGGVVVSGAAVIGQSGSATKVVQSTQKAAINWQSFSVAAGETVNFQQPNAAAITLNRVVGNERSVIEGALNANGRIFLINSNGLLFTQGSSVNAAGLVASTLDISNEDFEAGRYVFQGNGAGGAVLNLGTLSAADGGYVALLGGQVSNQGLILATRGTAVLSAGERVTLNFNGDSLMSVSIDQGALDALVENQQAIYADGGRVFLTARAADELLDSQVNNGGLVQAQTLGDLKGQIVAHAYGGTTTITGTLDASAPQGGDGGFIETSGDKVKIADSATIRTRSAYGESGKWLIDPVNYVIGAGGDIRGSFITNYLATEGSYEVQSTDGDIVIDDDISWYKNTLTLSSARNVLVNSVLSASETASLVVTTGSGTNTEGAYKNAAYGLYTAQGADSSFTGRIDFSGTGTVHMGTTGDAASLKQYTVIQDLAGFEAMRNNLNNVDALYVLGRNIDVGGADFAPIGSGTGTSFFKGGFDGFGHTLDNAVFTGGGFFGYVWTAENPLRNFGIVDGAIRQGELAVSYPIGLLAGYLYRTPAVNVFATGEIEGTATNMGGLAGQTSGSAIVNAHAIVDIINHRLAGVTGGLAGALSSTPVTNSFAAGSITLPYVPTTSAVFYAGGLAGTSNSTVENVYADVDIDSGAPKAATVGGLLGRQTATGKIINAYATGNVGGLVAGGLVGANDGGSIRYAYATGDVTGKAYSWDFNGQLIPIAMSAGGFVGRNTGTIDQAYATGSTTLVGDGTAGGFVGTQTGSGISNAYWTSNNGLSDGWATALSAEAAKDLSSYAGFEAGRWAQSAEGHPLLRQMPVFITLAGAAKEYGTAYTAGDFVYRGLQWGDTAARFAYAPDSALLSPYGRLNAGVYAVADVLGSDSYDSLLGSVTVAPKVVLVSGATVESKTYDGSTAAVVSGGVLQGFGDEDVSAALLAASFASKNAGSGIAVSFDYAFAYDGVATANYVAVGDGSATGDILPKAITADYTVASKEYDGSHAASVTGWSLNGVLGGDVVKLASTVAAFVDSNAGSGRTVTVSGVLGGGEGGNYTLADGEATADITPRALRLTGTTTEGSGSTVAAANLLASNLVAGDQLTLSGAVGLQGSGQGWQTVSDLSALQLVQPGSNYTLEGAQGAVYVSAASTGAQGGPQGGVVVSGSATITQSGNTTNIYQSSDKAVINWQRFSIPAAMVVNFDQPGVNSVALNRVIGNEASVIAGALKANGKVFILNSNGVLFSSSSQVNVGGLVASTQALADDDFNQGRFVFTANGAGGSVINDGDIVIVDGGYVAFLAGEVVNRGEVVARGGKIVMVGGGAMTLDEQGELLAGSAALTGTLTLDGSLDVSSAAGEGGRISTQAQQLSVAAGTVIDARGAGGANGDWLLRVPGVLTIGASGSMSGAQLSDALTRANVALASSNEGIVINAPVAWASNTLTLDSAKNIAVNAVMSASGSAGLTASWGWSKAIQAADYDPYDQYSAPQYQTVIYGIDTAFGVDANGLPNDSFAGRIDFSGSGAVRMGYAGALETYTVLNTVADLLAVNADAGNMSRNYILGSDIDLSGVADWTPIGLIDGGVQAYRGSFNGLGHVISNLSSTRNGLFADIAPMNTANETLPGTSVPTGNVLLMNAPAVSNLGLSGVRIAVTLAEEDAGLEAGRLQLGALGGHVGGTVKNVFATGRIEASREHAEGDIEGEIGGLVGNLNGSAYVADSYADVDIVASGYSRVGGFAGSAYGDITRSRAAGDVKAIKYSGSNMVGGFAGMISSIITDSLATGNVEGSMVVGGFGGYLVNGNIYDSEARGSVVLDDSNLGLAYEYASNPYADGAGAGGFIGANTGVIVRSRSSGQVSSLSGKTELLGGFAGYTTFYEGGLSINNYWNVASSGLAFDGRGNGIIPEGHHGGGTPIADALGLTPEQLHGGAQGLSAEEYSQVGEMLSGEKSLAQVRAEIAAVRADSAAAAAALQAQAEYSAMRAQGMQGMEQVQGSLSDLGVGAMDLFGLLNGLGSGNQSAALDSSLTLDDGAFSANIRGIEVDGVIYRLDEEEEAN